MTTVRIADAPREMRMRDSLDVLSGDCHKGFHDAGVAKCISPTQTFRTALERIRAMDRPILLRYRAVRRPSGIPQYLFIGTEWFHRYRPWQSVANGKGHTKAQAKASGIMEMAERYSCYRCLSAENVGATRRSSLRELRDNPFQFVHLEQTCGGRQSLSKRSASQLARASLPFYRGYSLDGRKAWLPLRLLWYCTGSNGMAAGNSLAEALVQAVCECVERHRLGAIEQDRLVTPVIDRRTITNPVVVELLERLDRCDGKVAVRDFSLGLPMPVVGVVRRAARGMYLTTAGVATDPAEALARALTESSQIDGRKNWRTAAQSRHLLAANVPKADFDAIPTVASDDLNVELAAMERLLREAGMQAFFADMTDPQLGIPAVLAFLAGAFQTVARHTVGHLFQCGAADALCQSRRYEDLDRLVRAERRSGRDWSLGWCFCEGVLHAARGRFHQALSPLARVATGGGHGHFPGTVISAALLAVCRHALGDVQAAAEWHVKVHELRPGFSFAQLATEYPPAALATRRAFRQADQLHRELVAVWRITGRTEGARRKACRAYARARPAILDALGRARRAYNAGDFFAAAGHAGQAAKLSPLAARVFNLPLFISRCSMAAGHLDQVRRHLARAARISPRDPEVEIIRSQLQYAEAEDSRLSGNAFPSHSGRVLAKPVPRGVSVSALEIRAAVGRLQTPPRRSVRSEL